MHRRGSRTGGAGDSESYKVMVWGYKGKEKEVSFSVIGGEYAGGCCPFYHWYIYSLGLPQPLHLQIISDLINKYHLPLVVFLLLVYALRCKLHSLVFHLRMASMRTMYFFFCIPRACAAYTYFSRQGAPWWRRRADWAGSTRTGSSPDGITNMF